MLLIFQKIWLVFEKLQKIMMFMYDTNQVILKGFLRDVLYAFPKLQQSYDLNIILVIVNSVNNAL